MFLCPAYSHPVIINGNFETDDYGWVHNQQTYWEPEIGPDGHMGVLFINDIPGPVAFAEQLITDLTPDTTYTITGYYKTRVDWHAGPSFKAYIDDTEKFSGGYTLINDWTLFSFNFTSVDADAKLHFETQVGSDSDYVIDQIAITPEPATLLLFGLGGLILRKRKA
jgi:hypothetical protein